MDKRGKKARVKDKKQVTKHTSTAITPQDPEGNEQLTLAKLLPDQMHAAAKDPPGGSALAAHTSWPCAPPRDCTRRYAAEG